MSRPLFIKMVHWNCIGVSYKSCSTKRSYAGRLGLATFFELEQLPVSQAGSPQPYPAEAYHPYRVLRERRPLAV
jgi:hypothetical protein